MGNDAPVDAPLGTYDLSFTPSLRKSPELTILRL